ncbi:hypothetical protein IEO21_08266 [Rhodonia placenta]|uniref:Uncharacterized protein n=1 Tax=Rhodonia placenta TaxID=104341 RepID=A0A8H7TZK1_9APHY|nr:hypothetical protein IEO21_08266 [Postia placenta]
METTVKRFGSAVAGSVGTAALGSKRKSGEMLGFSAMLQAAGEGPYRTAEDGDRMQKIPKLSGAPEGVIDWKDKGKQVDADEMPVQNHHTKTSPEPTTTLFAARPDDVTVPLKSSDGDDAMLDRFKRTVEGLGARSAKSMGKSLGGNAAAALAEARAAAEARVRERNKAEDGQDVSSSPDTKEALEGAAGQISLPLAAAVVHTQAVPAGARTSKESDRRLSMSDLVSSSEKDRFPGGQPTKFVSVLAESSENGGATVDTSTSTTPPTTPPPMLKVAAPPTRPAPVFSKPAPVFVAPPAPHPASQAPQPVASAGTSTEFSFKLPTANPFSLPAAMTLGVPASLPSPKGQKERVPLSAQSSKASVLSDAIFDKTEDIPAWMPTTQDTEYSIRPSQSQPQGRTHDDNLDDDDDSWHVDEKFSANQMWTPFGFANADTDDTWSTLPSRSTSQKGGDTRIAADTQYFTTTTAAQPTRDDERHARSVPDLHLENTAKRTL